MASKSSTVSKVKFLDEKRNKSNLSSHFLHKAGRLLRNCQTRVFRFFNGCPVLVSGAFNHIPVHISIRYGFHLSASRLNKWKRPWKCFRNKINKFIFLFVRVYFPPISLNLFYYFIKKNLSQLCLFAAIIILFKRFASVQLTNRLNWCTEKWCCNEINNNRRLLGRLPVTIVEVIWNQSGGQSV